LWRRRDPSPDDEPLAGGSREEIARGLTGLKFEYSDGFDWYDQWGDPAGKRKKDETTRAEHPNLFGLPEAVRITLWISPVTSRLSRPSGDEQNSEPPLVFQSVARLNLAGVSQRSDSTADKGAEKPDNQTREAPATGGTPQ
jgi:hypothetical protein